MDIKTLFNKARTEFLTLVLGIVSFVSLLLLPFLTWSAYRISVNVTFFDISAAVGLVALVAVGLSTALSGLLVNKVYGGKTLDINEAVRANVAGVAFNAVSLVLVAIMTLSKKSGASFGYGFFLYLIATVVIIVVNLLDANKNKDLAMKIVNEYKEKVAPAQEKSAVEEAKTTVQNTATEVKQEVSNVVENVQEVAADVKDSVEEKVEEVKNS